jgi:tetratricopeptide (TPR) repeat protein
LFLSTAGLAVVLLSKEGQQQDDSKFAGAYRFAEQQIEAALTEDLGPGEISWTTIQSDGEPNVWSVSGGITLQRRAGIPDYKPYAAIVLNLCQPFADRNCWHMESLTIGGLVVIRNGLAVLSQEPAEQALAVAEAAAKEPSVEAASRLPEPPLRPVPERQGVLPASEADLAPVELGNSPPIEASEGAIPSDNQPSQDSQDAQGSQDSQEDELALSPPLPNSPSSAVTTRAADQVGAAPANSLVFLIQSRLRGHAYDPGPADGRIGPKTVTAIEAFQRDNGLTVDGKAAQSLLEHLERPGLDKGRSVGGVAAADVAEAPTARASGNEETRMGFEAAKKGRHDQAIDHYTRAIQSGGLAPERLAYVFKGRGLAYHKRGSYDRAVEDYDNAIRLKPDYAEAFHSRGPAQYNRGFYDRAIADYDMTIRLKPGFAQAFHSRGLAEQKRGSYGRAIEDYDMAIRLRPDFAQAFHSRGIVRHGRGAYDRAIEDYDNTIRLKPDYAEAYHNRGLAYDAGGAYDKAIEDYDSAIRLNPKRAATYANRGLGYYRKGLLEQARDDFSKAILLDPGLASAYFGRGVVHEATGAHESAVEDFKKAYTLDDQNPRYRTKMEQLGSKE